MNRAILSLCLILGLAGTAPAQMNITGYLTTEMMPVEVDSVYFEFGPARSWFQTPGWNANPGETASFTFPEFAGWPAIIKLELRAAGMPVRDSIYRPMSDSWYPLRPPFDRIRFMFHGELGVQEEQSPAPVSAPFPGIISYGRLLELTGSGLELVNHLGQRVEPLNLAPGVYFCRLQDSRKYYRLLVIR